jgi:hypothetical protein
MDPVTGFAVACGILQVIDFSSRIISRSHEFRESADGRIEQHVILDNAAAHLLDLCNGLQRYDGISVHRLNGADEQLYLIKLETELVVKELRNALDKAKLVGTHKKWRSFYQAFQSVWQDNDIAGLARRLDELRKQVDTALLFSLRYTESLYLQLPLTHYQPSGRWLIWALESYSR